MKLWPRRSADDQDWSRYLSQAPTSSKRLLIEECRRRGVIIFVDDPTETTEGVYSNFRAVASEAELQRRLLGKAASTKATLANVIAAFALVVSVVALIKSFQ
ncbi:hypothetical protein [Limnohabitans sp. Hippo3]|uniref:hypothetical protein n=1 Tax=Limnohabitans sp. Hippo3 TaxID=1597956 RepID=UPI000D3C4B4E|nr:hypothetical protein [Limnohabitans sp. Hippo3]PUE43433.1 hypothetical protein B9Z34_00925 [Limnohabitans sp. Hippo3]